MIAEPGDAERDVNMNKTFHEQTDDELSERELKQIKVDDQAIQTILLGSDIGIQEKKAKLFNEWERFTSNERESVESYYHRFLKLMNDLKRNKYFPEKITSNLKFLNNLQPEWSRHVTIVHQTKDLHTADYTQLYDFLKYNQKENYMQQPMLNPEDITDPTTALNMALALMAKTFKLNYSTPTNNNQRISSNPRNRQIAQPGKRKPRKGQNRIKTRQKQEACQSQEKFKAVTVERGRKTKENKKRMATNAYTYQKLCKFKEKKKREWPYVQYQESTTTGT
nr:hypothetical protein [Tanacetum cinerariifolium]